MRTLSGVGVKLLSVGRYREPILPLIIVSLALVLTDHVVKGGAFSEYEKKVIASNPTEIPCDINVSKCGPVHTVKIYKNGQRVFTYNNGTQPAERKADNDLARISGDHFKINTDTGGLHIPTVFLLDEGRYQCETTYILVQESCTTIAITKLITLSIPSQPEITVDGHSAANMTRIGPFVEGSKIGLKCESTGKPQVNVVWFNGTQKMAGDYIPLQDTTETETGLNTIELTVTRADLFSRFECQAENEAIQTPHKIWVDMDVHVRPLTVDIEEPTMAVVEGQEVTVVCVVTGARPEAKIEWFKGTDEKEASAPDEVTVEENGFTKTTKSSFTFKVSSSDDGEKIRCRTKNQVMEDRGEEALEDLYVLDVQYAPIVDVKPSGEGQVNYNSSFEIFCEYDANPKKLSDIQWYRNGKLIDFNDTSDEDHQDDDYDDEDRIMYRKGSQNDDDDDDGDDTDENGDNDDDDDDDDSDFIYPSLFIVRALHVDKGEYECAVTNSIGRGRSTKTLKLDVTYPPVVEVKLDPEEVLETDELNVTLTCDLKTANPDFADSFRWYKRDAKTKKEVFLKETEDDDYVLEFVDRDDIGDYWCVGHNSIGWGLPSKSKKLIVKYPPGEAEMRYEPAKPRKGANVTFHCDVKELGEPPAHEYRWLRNEILLANATESSYVVDDVLLVLVANYSCAAVNEVGVGPDSDIYVDVVEAPPFFIQDLPNVYGVLENATELGLTCQVECYPKCDVMWYKGGEYIREEAGLFTIKESYLEPDYQAGTLHSVLSTLSWNPINWPEGKLRREDNAIYKCKADTTIVGPGVESITSFRVEYPPEDISLSDDVVDVYINEDPETVTCSANGDPEPLYKWIYEGEEQQFQAELNLGKGITKEGGGTYTCIAYNKHGYQEASTLINVLYKPECNIDKKYTNDGQIVITCEVSANPTDVTFEWFKDDDLMTDDIHTEGLESVVQFPEDASRYGVYKCATNNSANVKLGDSEPCIIEITGEGGWLERLAENKAVFVSASIAAGVLLMLIVITVIIVVVCLVKRRAAAKGDDGKKKEPDSRAFYENLPFHGLQAPPNKPFKPILPDLEYADVDFPAQPMNNNDPHSKAKIVERILREDEDEAGATDIPVRPPRAKTSTRK